MPQASTFSSQGLNAIPHTLDPNSAEQAAPEGLLMSHTRKEPSSLPEANICGCWTLYETLRTRPVCPVKERGGGGVAAEADAATLLAVTSQRWTVPAASPQESSWDTLAGENASDAILTDTGSSPTGVCTLHRIELVSKLA